MDLCTIDQTVPSVTKTVFDPATGDFTFETDDVTMADVTPGDYVFDITATVGTTVSTVQFTLTIADPCIDQITLSIPGVHFVDTSYLLGATETMQAWDKMIDLVNTDEWVNCGNILIEFFYDDGVPTPVDPLIFDDVRTASGGEFTFLQTIDFDHIGVYDIIYEAYYESYVAVKVVSSAFQVEILDACPQPLSILPSTPVNQVYTVTDNALVYQVPAFGVDPSPTCTLTYTARVIDDTGADYPCPTCFNAST